MTMNKKYGRVTEATNTHEISKLFIIKTEKESEACRANFTFQMSFTEVLQN